MLITELFDKEAKIKVEVEKPELFQASAPVNGRLIVFDAMIDDADENTWEVAFRQIGGKNVRGASHGMTGGGAEFEVLAMIKDAMFMFADKYKPSEIKFTAEWDSGKDGKTRADVYEKMIKRLKVPGYTLERNDDDEWHEDTSAFTLKRK